MELLSGGTWSCGRVTLLIPESLNDGSVVPPSRLKAYERSILEIAHTAREATGRGEEGFTVSNVVGVWRSPSGTEFREPSLRYELDVADAECVLEAVRSLAEQIRLDLAQEAIYVTVSAIEALTITDLVLA